MHAEDEGDELKREEDEGDDGQCLHNLVLSHFKQRDIGLAQFGGDRSMGRDELGNLRTLRENALGTRGKGSAEEVPIGELSQEMPERLFLSCECRFDMQELSTDLRDESHGRALVSVEHIAFDAREIVGNMVDMVAY